MQAGCYYRVASLDPDVPGAWSVVLSWLDDAGRYNQAELLCAEPSPELAIAAADRIVDDMASSGAQGPDNLHLTAWAETLH